MPEAAREERSYTLREAASTRPFYVLLVVTTVTFFVGAAVNFHLIAYLDDTGIGASVGTLVLAAWAACTLLGGFTTGFIADRVPLKPMLAAAYAGLAGSLLLLLAVGGAPAAFLWAAAYGITFGMNTTLHQLVWPVYFGREALGAIRGVVMAFNMTSNAFGPTRGGVRLRQDGQLRPDLVDFLHHAGVDRRPNVGGVELAQGTAVSVSPCAMLPCAPTFDGEDSHKHTIRLRNRPSGARDMRDLRGELRRCTWRGLGRGYSAKDGSSPKGGLSLFAAFLLMLGLGMALVPPIVKFMTCGQGAGAYGTAHGAGGRPV